MNSMEHDSPANQGQYLRRQGADGAHSLLNPQEQVKAASRDARVAQQEAQKAMKRAYIQQVAAQEKVERASEQVVAEQELARRVAVQAATQAAEKATDEQKERASEDLHDTSIAQEATQSALASVSANQLGNQQGEPCREDSPNQRTNISQCHAFTSALSGNVAARSKSNGSSASAQMVAAQNLAAGASDPLNQHAAREQAEANGDGSPDCNSCTSSRYCSASHSLPAKSLPQSLVDFGRGEIR